MYPVDSGFWPVKWQTAWRKKQFDKLYDRIEATVKGSAEVEVANLGVGKAAEIRAHLMKQFGGAGEGVEARQERYEAGMPESPGAAAFPEDVNIPDKLRQLETERCALYKLCPTEKRDAYEYGQWSKLVKIVIRHLRRTRYSDTVKQLLQEVKARQELKAATPIWNEEKKKYEPPKSPAVKENTDDWDYKNFHEDWLPKWSDLKSRLISVYKETTFSTPGDSKKRANSLPVMLVPTGGGKYALCDGNGRPNVTGRAPDKRAVLFMPGAGNNPRPRCFGCGAYGHRKGDPGCPAKSGDWHECCPPKFLEKAQKLMKGKGKDGMKNKRAAGGVCFHWRDTGKCPFGPSCKFKHPPKSSAGEKGGKGHRKKAKMSRGGPKADNGCSGPVD